MRMKKDRCPTSMIRGYMSHYELNHACPNEVYPAIFLFSCNAKKIQMKVLVTSNLYEADWNNPEASALCKNLLESTGFNIDAIKKLLGILSKPGMSFAEARIKALLYGINPTMLAKFFMALAKLLKCWEKMFKYCGYLEKDSSSCLDFCSFLKSEGIA